MQDGIEERAARLLNVGMTVLLGLAMGSLAAWVTWRSAVVAWTEGQIVPGLMAVAMAVIWLRSGVWAVRFAIRKLRDERRWTS